MDHLQLIANGDLRACSWLQELLGKRLKSWLRKGACFRAIFRRASRLTRLKLRKHSRALPSPAHSFNAAHAAPLHFPTTLSQPQN